MEMRLIFLILPTALVIQSAWAAPKPLTSGEREFLTSCSHAFALSSEGDADGIGKKICDCATHESRHEQVSAAALKRETARIKADPKYKIEDQKLLNAIQYCSIEVMKAGGK